MEMMKGNGIEWDGVRKDAVTFLKTLTQEERGGIEASRIEMNLCRELLKVHGFRCSRCRNLQTETTIGQFHFGCTMTDLNMTFDLRKGEWLFRLLPECCG